MKILFVKRLIMLSVLGLLTSVAAHAQSGSDFTVTIPFDFSVGGKTLIAGQYHIGRSTRSSADGLLLRDTNGRGGVFSMTVGIHSEDVQQQSKVVFRRYGNQYFLAEVWISGNSAGRGLPASRKERSIARAITKQGATSETVALSGDKQ